MGRMLDVEIEDRRIKINFPYDRELVDVVRALPDRWYDNRTRTWFVPLQHLNFVIQRLESYHFDYTARLRRFRLDQGEEIETVTAVAGPPVPEGSWTVSRLNQTAQRALKERFDEPIWVVGELQDFDKNRSGRYRNYFFDLVERPLAGANEVARIKAVLFERDRKAIEAKLEASNLSLRDGGSVRFRGKIDLYPRNGRFQIIVDDIDPAFTAGEMELNRERVFQGLRKKGLEERNLRLNWPICPLRVGLITSQGSDAYNDFIHHVEQSGWGFEITVHHANVQGVYTEASVLRALAYFRERSEEFDLIAIVRGGGSRTDLAYFDTEAIGEAVCRHPVKVICGIGHQRDRCLLDMICESTKTPTAAAERIVEAVGEFLTGLESTYREIGRRSELRLAGEEQRLLRGAARLERLVQRRLSRARRKEDQLRSALIQGARRGIERSRREVADGRERLAVLSLANTTQKAQELSRRRRELSMPRMNRELARLGLELDRMSEQLARSAQRQTDRERRSLEHLEEQLTLLDPRRVLERGFAIVRRDDGLVRSREDLAIGEQFSVEWADGVIRGVRVEEESATQDS